MKVLKFGAVWCPGCIIMKPRFAEIEKELPWLLTEYFDVDEHRDLVEKYKLEDFPAFLFLDKEGREFQRFYGEIEKDKLIKFILENRDR
jgi:thiol-disulfide isomerase/thioredoxin